MQMAAASTSFNQRETPAGEPDRGRVEFQWPLRGREPHGLQLVGECNANRVSMADPAVSAYSQSITQGCWLTSCPNHSSCPLTLTLGMRTVRLATARRVRPCDSVIC